MPGANEAKAFIAKGTAQAAHGDSLEFLLQQLQTEEKEITRYKALCGIVLNGGIVVDSHTILFLDGDKAQAPRICSSP